MMNVQDMLNSAEIREEFEARERTTREFAIRGEAMLRRIGTGYCDSWTNAKFEGYVVGKSVVAVENAKLHEEHDAALGLAYARAATAEQRAAKLSEELDQVKHLLNCESIKAERAENRAEAAEARIREAEGQEPIGGWYSYNPIDGKLERTDPRCGRDVFRLYTRPIPPADVAELQTKLAKLREDLAEKDETITALRMGWTECSESNKDVEAALEGFSYSGSYGDGVRKLREEHDAALRLAYARAATAEQRAEAAEARIKEAEMQEARGELACDARTGHMYGVLWNGGAPNIGEKVYTRPIPSADVQKLQAKYDRLEQIASDAPELNNTQAQRIAELERKLAEQQAINSTLDDALEEFVIRAISAKF